MYDLAQDWKWIRSQFLWGLGQAWHNIAQLHRPSTHTLTTSEDPAALTQVYPIPGGNVYSVA